MNLKEEDYPNILFAMVLNYKYLQSIVLLQNIVYNINISNSLPDICMTI